MASLLASLKAGSSDGASVTSSAIDTTGAGLIVVAIVDDDGTATLTDSAGNTWTHLTTRSGTYAVRLHYCLAPVTSAAHTFSSTGTAPLLLVEAWASTTGAFRFDDENGAFTLVGALNPRLTGSVTPGRSNAVVISAAGNDYFADSLMSEHSGGFTTSQNLAFASGQHYGGGIAHKVVSSVDPVEAGWYGNLAVFPNVPLAIAVFSEPSPPVTYEDPCSITEPRIFATVTTETETIKIGVQPLRDSAALGGYAEPRLIDVSPVTRVASDVATGAWSAQTAAWKWADTDRANRARSATRTSFRGCDAELYLTSNTQRLAGGPPRVMFAGTIYEDSADENLVLSTTINDLIGSNYSLFSEEKQIPQRVIEKNWFPNAPDAALGQAEPIVGGRRAPLDPHALAAATLPEGVSKGVYVGQVRIGGAHGTPTGGDLATVVAALEASRAAGTLYTDYGSRIGYSDATVLQGYSSVPSDYDALAQVIGYGDLDALIAETSHTGGDLFEAVVIASHAISEILDGFNGDPSIWVGDTQVAAADIGVSVWAPNIPGDASWASDIGSDLFTDIIGADGTTRRYTLILFDPGSAHGLAVAGGAVVHVDCIGLEDVGDGTGAAITDAFSLYRHLLDNFILQDYQSGSWLASPQFLFSDGTTLLDRVDAESFETASTIAALNVTGGYLGSFTIDTRVSVRDIVATCNLSWGCLLAQDDYQRLTVKVLDTRRANFIANRYTGTAHRTLDGKRDILPGFRIDAKPDWQVNQLTYQYAKNNYTGSYERDAGGGGNTVFVEDVTSQARDGVIKKTVEFAYVRDDATADAVAAYYLSLFKDLPRVVTYTRRGLCGLEDDLLDGVPVSHWNGYGANGWVDHSVWIIGKTFDPKRMACTFTALDVERVLVEAETAETVYLTSDPVALDDLVADDGSGAFLTEG